jgi:nucleolar protein 4
MADVGLDPKTVFVKGVSYELADQDVEQAFSEIGPVRKCFLLQGKGHHKVCICRSGI